VGLRGIDRVALKACLDECKLHQAWLRDRIPQVWIATLEARMRRRDIIASVLWILLVWFFLVDFLVVGNDAINKDGVSGGILVAGLFVVGLTWIMVRLIRNLVGVWRQRPSWPAA
jgi:hypothetical protein